MPGSFDGPNDLFLMLVTASGDAARNDLAPFRNEPGEDFIILVVDVKGAIFAEAADSLFQY